MNDRLEEAPSGAEARTAGALPISPSLEMTLDAVHAPRQVALVNRRVVFLSAVAICVAFATAVVARLLTALIGWVTGIAFYGRFSTGLISPADNRLGLFVIIVPVIGGLIVGLMARYGSQAIRGHGIPEAMEQVLLNQSRIAPRLIFLKPLSSAVAIGTGGPFGAEGPIIATGGALGSLIGQLLHTTADERKTLLAAGAAAGMSAIFGSPVSAVLLAVELLLFEFRPRSIIPVALASVTAAGLRYATIGSAPVFAMTNVAQPSGEALIFYVLLGAFMGLVAVGVTRLLYGIEDAFDHLPIHWMWWPAIGGLAVGVIGYFAPHTLGVGYENIEQIVSGQLVGRALLFLCVMKFISWSIALGSGTSGGTLAPLFTIGGALGASIGGGVAATLPALGVDPRIAGLVGMAAIFAGASRALLASVVFAFETTLQPVGLLPLLGGCAAAYLVSCLLMQNTIMTEKIARRGVRVPAEYAADYLDQVLVRDAASAPVVTLRADQTMESVRVWLHSGVPEAHHQGYPVLDEQEQVRGVVTRRDLLELSTSGDLRVLDAIKRPPAVIEEDHSLREAADHMVREKVGRLIIVSTDETPRMVGILTRGDILSAHARRLGETHDAKRSIRIRQSLKKRFSKDN
ncbi:H+/Cl- antiporter ClcA [Abditibacterium utsteinense]|uniref:H+/Cl-antiporter ClcA n=1 Tax=Abditibacterium utsteinense TaxID=1960156 RepID=A0A2S8SUI1_9BACT|nr:chloride channel protein [Abditibacterium utsteinense]PQV64455.1 H+/Cl- antiporter ClcA [Abditibacterium utsteinense]